MQQTVEDAKAVLEDAGTNPLPATPEAVQQLLLYAHRLGYSTFLPLLGEQLVQHGVAQHFRPSPASLQNSYLKKAAMYAAYPPSLSQFPLFFTIVCPGLAMRVPSHPAPLSLLLVQ